MIVSILQIRKLKLKVFQGLTWGHVARNCLSWRVNPDGAIPSPYSRSHVRKWTAAGAGGPRSKVLAGRDAEMPTPHTKTQSFQPPQGFSVWFSLSWKIPKERGT